jgi:hypothetical protein
VYVGTNVTSGGQGIDLKDLHACKIMDDSTDDSYLPSCHKAACLATLVAMALFDIKYPHSINFGTMISHAGPLLGKGMVFKLDDRQNFDGFPQCNDLSNDEVSLHNLLAGMAASMGIGDNHERVSLFELPTILDGRRERSQYLQVGRDLFRYFTCQDPVAAKDPYLVFVTCDEVWLSFMENRVDHPCLMKSGQHEHEHTDLNKAHKRLCCPQSIDSLGLADMAGVLTVMAMATGRFQSMYNATALMQAISDSQDHIMGYPLISLNDKMSYGMVNGGMLFDLDSKAATCSFQTDEAAGLSSCSRTCPIRLNNCNILHPTLTNQGLCYGFNTPSARDLLGNKNEPYVEAFEKAFASELRKHGNVLEMSFASQHDESGFTAVLDRGVVGSINHRDVTREEKISFRVGVSSFLDSFDFE